MSNIKTWDEQLANEWASPSEIKVAMQSEIDELRAELDAAKAEINTAKLHSALKSVELLKVCKEFAAGAAPNALRYQKLRDWMGSNAKDGWDVVCQLGAVAAWEGYKAMDEYLDALPSCSFGLLAAAPKEQS